MQTIYKNCQSCRMPLKRDAQGGGTHADGSRSTVYCSHCYLNGSFTLPHMTVDEMKKRVKGKMREMGMPGFMANFLSRSIPRLERWKKND